MKKIILSIIAVMALTMGQAYATDISVDVGSRIDTVSKQFTRVTEIRLQEDNLSAQLTTSGTIDRTEVAYAITPIASISILQVAVGTGVVTGAGTTGHFTYSLEPRVVVPVTDKLAFSAGYMLRDDVQKFIKDRTQLANIGVSYKLTPSVSALAKVETSTGDYAYKQAIVGAKYSF